MAFKNVGEVTDLLDLVRASEIEVFTLPLSSEREYEVWVRTLETPSQVRAGETFPVHAIVETTTDTEGSSQTLPQRHSRDRTSNENLETGKAAN